MQGYNKRVVRCVPWATADDEAAGDNNNDIKPRIIKL